MPANSFKLPASAQSGKREVGGRGLFVTLNF
jgi:hypothetical protein